MNFKSVTMILLLTVQIFCHSSISLAAPPQDELNQYLAQLGWTQQDLENYLSYYEIPLDKINSVEELQSFLGTPINPNNYQQLLTKYNLTDNQLQSLLAQYGDSIDQYKFIEDLDTAVDFYKNHTNTLADIKSDLDKVGITQQEVTKLFGYLSQVEENNKNQLDKTQVLDTNLEDFLSTSDPANLTSNEIDELANIINEMIDLYDINVKFKMNNQNITLKQLFEMDNPSGNLYTAIYSNDGELLMDFNLPADSLQGIIAGWDELLSLGILSNDLVDFLHDQKYDNANLFK